MITPPALISVSSADIVRHFGRWQDHAANQPVLVTHHGRDRIVLVSVAHYRDLAGGRPSPSPGSIADRDALQRLTELLTQGFMAFDPDMTVTMANGAAAAFMRLPREAILGHRLADLVPGIEETLGYISLARAAASGATSTFEMPSFAYEGRWLLFRTFPVGDGAACLFRDITDEVAARRGADARTATLAAIAAHGAIGRARLSARATFVEVDAAFAGFAGFAPEGLARAKLTDILSTRDRSRTGDAVEAVLEGGSARAIEVAILTKSGAERPVRVGLAPLRDHGGVSGAIVVMTGQSEPAV